MRGFKYQDLNYIFQNKMFKNIEKSIVSSVQYMIEDRVSRKEKVFNHEEKIRNCLLREYLENSVVRRKLDLEQFKLRFSPERLEGYNPITQTYVGRSDIFVESKDQFTSFNDEFCFIMECKRLNMVGNKLIKAYVDDGVCRFVVDPIKYQTKFGKNFMLGFVVEKCDLSDLNDKISEMQIANTTLPEIRGIDENMAKDKYLLANTTRYQTGETELVLRNLLVDMSDIIKPNVTKTSI